MIPSLVILGIQALVVAFALVFLLGIVQGLRASRTEEWVVMSDGRGGMSGYPMPKTKRRQP